MSLCAKQLGQYFTTNKVLQQKVVSFIQNNPNEILEPSIGRGDLVQAVLSVFPTARFDMYEIDKTVPLVSSILKEDVHFGDFIDAKIEKKYKTIIGNPPYIKVSKLQNLYIQFIAKCYSLLEENGELIFIVPSDFLKKSSSLLLLNDMMQHGTFTDIYHPENERLFENASIDVVVFRYCKNPQLPKQVLWTNVNHVEEPITKYIHFSKETIQLSTKQMSETILSVGDLFHIYVGIVNGREHVYWNELLGNLSVLRGENRRRKYIYITEFPTENNDVNNYLLLHKENLIHRKIRKFNENNWFEWGALRNMRTIKENLG